MELGHNSSTISSHLSPLTMYSPKYITEDDVDKLVKCLLKKYIQAYAQKYGNFPTPTDNEIDSLFE